MLEKVDPLWRDQKYRERYANGGKFDWNHTVLRNRDITARELYDECSLKVIGLRAGETGSMFKVIAPKGITVREDISLRSSKLYELAEGEVFFVDHAEARP